MNSNERKFKNCYLGLLGNMVNQNRRGSNLNLNNINESPTFRRKFNSNSSSRNKPRLMWSFERDAYLKENQLRQNQVILK